METGELGAGGGKMRGGGGKWAQPVPHSHMVDKNWDTLGRSHPSPRPDSTAQGSSARKIDPHNFWL